MNTITDQLAEALRIVLVQFGPYVDGQGAAKFHAVNIGNAALTAYDAQQTPPLPLIRKVCATCGSEDVSADAYARWNFARQEWEVSNIMDKGHACEDCGGECGIFDEVVAE